VEDRRVNRLGTIWRLIVLVGLISAIGCLALHREFLQRSLLERVLLRFSRLAPIVFVLVYAAATVLISRDQKGQGCSQGRARKIPKRAPHRAE